MALLRDESSAMALRCERCAGKARETGKLAKKADVDKDMFHDGPEDFRGWNRTTWSRDADRLD